MPPLLIAGGGGPVGSALGAAAAGAGVGVIGGAAIVHNSDSGDADSPPTPSDPPSEAIKKEIGGKVQPNGVVEAEGGRERAQKIFDKNVVPGSQTSVKDTTGGGTGVAGQLSDGTPIRIRFKPDGTTRLDVGKNPNHTKYFFP
jgi:hypothetical protein